MAAQVVGARRWGRSRGRRSGLGGIGSGLLERPAHHAYTACRGAPPTIELDLAPNVDEVTVQVEGGVQVTVSLLEIALYAARPDGSVCLRSRHGGEVTATAADDGPGMDAETSPRVFEPFFTTEPPGEGTGLGLSLAYDIVTAGHGGEIELSTTLGEGATFTVHLPAAGHRQTHAPAAAPSPSAASDPS